MTDPVEGDMLAVKPYFVKRVLFLNGLTRSGKFFLGNLLASLTHLEHYQYAAILEHLAYMVHLGEITEETAAALIRLHIDDHAYDMAIGRNLNMRSTDLSSLQRSPDLALYLRRSEAADIPVLLNDFESNKRRPCFILHDCFNRVSLFCSAGFEDMKMIHLDRHPIDLAYSWYQRGWGTRFGTDPMSFVPVVTGDKTPLPWFAASWKERYENLSPMDRVIESISYLRRTGEEAFQKLSIDEQKQIFWTTYESLVECPEPTLRAVADFLNVSVKEDALSMVLKQERVPGKSPAESRNKKLSEIREKSSPESFRTLLEVASQYEAGHQ